MRTVVQQKSSFTATATKWCFVFSWRFFSGAFMDGSKHNDATWWLDSSTRYPPRKRTWWKRKARLKRAAWRNCIFWPAIFVSWSLVFYTLWASIVLGCIVPVGAYIAFRRIRLALFQPVVANHSDGSVAQHWVMKPKTRRALNKVRRPEGMRKRPGLALPSEIRPGVHTVPIPEHIRSAVALEVADELDGEPPLELKLLMAPDSDK